MSTSSSQISAKRHGLSRRFTKPKAEDAGVVEGPKVHVSGKPGRIVIETDTEATLDQMLAAFDPQKHGSEAMESGAVGVEAFISGEMPMTTRCA
jgi:hypothetical protein